MGFQMEELLAKFSGVTYIIAGVVAAVVIARLSRDRALDAFPTVGSSGFIDSWLAGFKFLVNGADIIEQGYEKYQSAPFKVADMYSWKVILSDRKHVEELQKAPEETISFKEGPNEEFHLRHTMGDEVHDNTYHVGVIRSWLIRSIATTYHEMRDEMLTALDEILDLREHEWKSITALSAVQKVVCRTKSRLLVGLPLCRNEDWIDLNVRCTLDIVKTGIAIGLFPKFMRPLIACLFTAVARDNVRGAKLLGPIIGERLKHLDECGGKWTERPNDLLSWLMEAAEGPQLTIKALTARTLFAGFAAIHSTSNSFTQALFYLAANPQYIQPLREEVEEIIEEHGWSKAAIDKMRKLDSFFRECQRIEGLGTITVLRKALKDFTFSDGTFIPRGTSIGVASRCIHHDEKFYKNADVFKPFRFSDMDERSGGRGKYQFISTATEYQPFGHGRHACPGRFLAANEMKTMLAHIVTSYDIKLEDGKTRPRSLHVGTVIAPNPYAKVLFRRRVID